MSEFQPYVQILKGQSLHCELKFVSRCIKYNIEIYEDIVTFDPVRDRYFPAIITISFVPVIEKNIIN